MIALPEDTPEVDCRSLKLEASWFHLVNRLLYHNAGANTQSISVKQFFMPTLHCNFPFQSSQLSEVQWSYAAPVSQLQYSQHLLHPQICP